MEGRVGRRGTGGENGREIIAVGRVPLHGNVIKRGRTEKWNTGLTK